jgi:type I restriction enzyme S subunit
MKWKKAKIGSFLKRSKIPIDIVDDEGYKRVTIRINHNGISVRDYEVGKNIGTKKQFILKAGQFVMSKIDARYGAFGIAPDEVNKAIITGNFWAYDVDFSQVNIEWFNQFTNSPQFYELCERASTGITHRKYLSEPFFLTYEINLPSVEEQLSLIKRIKTLRNKHNYLTIELTHQIDVIKKLRQRLFQDAVQGKIVEEDPNDEPAIEILKKIKAEKEQLVMEKKLKKEKELPQIKPEEIPFIIPEKWAWCKLGQITYYSEAGKSYQANEYPANEDEIGVIKTSAITTGLFLENENKTLPDQTVNIDKLRIAKDDLIFCRASGSIGFAGKSCIVNESPKAKLILSDKSVRYVFPEYISKKYIQVYSSTHFANDYFLKLGTAKSTSMNNITRDQFNNLTFPLPPYSQQIRIIQQLEQLMQTCDALEANSKQTLQRNEQLLQQVLREALTPGVKQKAKLTYVLSF